MGQRESAGQSESALPRGGDVAGSLLQPINARVASDGAEQMAWTNHTASYLRWEEMDRGLGQSERGLPLWEAGWTGVRTNQRASCLSGG